MGESALRGWPAPVPSRYQPLIRNSRRRGRLPVLQVVVQAGDVRRVAVLACGEYPAFRPQVENMVVVDDH